MSCSLVRRLQKRSNLKKILFSLKSNSFPPLGAAASRSRVDRYASWYASFMRMHTARCCSSVGLSWSHSRPGPSRNARALAIIWFVTLQNSVVMRSGVL